MEKEFIPYELALKLKKLGFNEDCFAMWQKNKKLWYCNKNTTIKNYYSEYKYCSNFTAPLWQQSFDFILNKFNLVGTVYANASGYLYEIHDSAIKGGTHRAESGYDGDCEYSGTYTTYHKARKSCLEKLIELCQKLEKI